MTIAPAKDLTSIGTLAARYGVSVRRIEELIQHLGISGLWRIGEVVHLDANATEKLVSHLGERVTLSNRRGPRR